MSGLPGSIEGPPAESKKETRRLLWDLPTRLLHWVLVGLFAGAFTVATVTSKHSSVFLVHMVLGLILLLAVLLRFVWGFVGSHPSRFTSFLFSPQALIRYLQQALEGEDRRTPGHNPGSSYAIYAMILLPLGIVATGIAQGMGLKWTEEVHQVLAYTMVGVIVLHILGLARHTFRHRENIGMSMVHGKREIPEIAAIPSARPWAAVALLSLLGAWTALLIGGLDIPKKQIYFPALDRTIRLGEPEKPFSGQPQEHHENGDRD